MTEYTNPNEAADTTPIPPVEVPPSYVPAPQPAPSQFHRPISKAGKIAMAAGAAALIAIVSFGAGWGAHGIAFRFSAPRMMYGQQYGPGGLGQYHGGTDYDSYGQGYGRGGGMMQGHPGWNGNTESGTTDSGVPGWTR